MQLITGSSRFHTVFSDGGWSQMGNMASVVGGLRSVEFEVFGKVQGVFFRKYTQDTAASYKLVGWVMNTERGTVVGIMQGQEDAVKRMEDWLRTKGSPMSTIEKLELKNQRALEKLEHSRFNVKEEGKEWLRTIGSPKSRIDNCHFKQEKDLKNAEFAKFEIHRPKKTMKRRS